MEDFESIYQSIQIDNFNENEKLFTLVIEDFSHILEKDDMEYRFFGDTKEEIILNIIEMFLPIYPQYAYQFYLILSYYGYNPKHEIIRAISDLCDLSDSEKNSENIKNLLLSPYIKDISYNAKTGIFNLYSLEYENIRFQKASSYLHYHKKILEYIKTRQLWGRCHDCTQFLTSVIRKYYAVTSLCEQYFDGYHYHSYALNRNQDKAIDIRHNAVLSVADYNQLFGPVVLKKTIGHDIDYQIWNMVKEGNYSSSFHPLLNLALNEQTKQYGISYKKSKD